MEILIYLIFASAAVYASHKNYKGWKSFYVRPSTLEQVQGLHSMVEEMTVDFLMMPTVKDEGIALVGPECLDRFTKALDNLHISYKIHCNNINSYGISFRALDSDDKKIAQMEAKNFAKLGETKPYKNFHNLSIINKYLSYQSKYYRDRVTLVQAGESYELEPMYYLKISNTNFNGKKPVIIIDGGMHAREWISPAVVMYAIHKLVDNVTEPDLLDKFDWILFPVVNPDGYNYTFTRDRFWRKTRSISSYNDCRGVDINRNFKYKWEPKPSNPCKQTFPGEEPMSEFESRSLQNILHQHRKNTRMYINMHSYGSYILYPYGHDGKKPKNTDSLQLIGDAMAEAINSVTKFKNYSVGNVVEKLHYKTTGSATDYAHSIGIPLVFVFELPGFAKKVDGFVVEPRKIKPIVKETWRAIVTGVRMIKTDNDDSVCKNRNKL